MKEQIQALLPTECPWRDTLYWYPVTDSTNTQAKLFAKQGAAHGTVLISGHQTQGRGRLGRSFYSPADAGLYLSVILRPNCRPEQLMHLTCVAAVAACRAVSQVSGLTPRVKWINDLVLQDKKLGGILTELSCSSVTGLVDYAVIGIGINCHHRQQDFPAEIADIATSLLMESGQKPSRAALAAALIENMALAADTFVRDQHRWMAAYRQLCLTIGKEIQVIQEDDIRPGKALDVDENGSLLVCFSDGYTEAVQAGEVSVRGMYGYV